MASPTANDSAAMAASSANDKVRGLFLHYRLPDWKTLYQALAFGYRAPAPIPFDTS